MILGDIGQWNANGTLTIIDRKKHIFKLQQGEYIAPEKIENIYIHSKFIAQLFVHGESLKSCLVAVVVPDEEANIHDVSFEELCSNKEVKKMILVDMLDIGKKAGLCSFEQVRFAAFT
uniref:AMP-binding_C domain-containing protein n=1 Tax=Ascaris lumbricoides TaxID=6252 RepID=A0A0M3IWR9_ASCLU